VVRGLVAPLQKASSEAFRTIEENAMPFIPVPDTAEVVLTFTGPNGNFMKNVINVREATLVSWTPALLQGVIDLVQNWHNTTAKLRQSNQISLVSILARDLNTVDSFVVEETMTVVGSVASPAMPANVTFCVKGLTGLAGRSFRSRTYWIGLAESMVAGDFVATVDADAIVAAMNTLRANLNTQGINPVVVSRFTNGAPRVTGVATDISNYAKTDNRVDTQRRRLFGEGQ
jgi:hypothetical protein